MNWKCRLGIHNWYYLYPMRYCLDCHKHQRVKEYQTEMKFDMWF